MQGASRLKASTLERSRKVWLYMKARELSSSFEYLSKTKMTTILAIIARKHGFALIEEASLLLSVADCIAVRDHVGLGNNGLHRLKQAIEALVPFLKGILIPPSIINKVACEERSGVIPCRVYEMNCLLNKKLNKRNMCTFFFCENVGQLLADMQRSTFKAGEHEDSVTFSSMENKLISSIGIDKGGNNLLATMRDCNRRRGNAGIHVQCPACLEGPVAECHKNLQLTMFNPMFPVQQTFNDLVSDYYFSLVIVGKKNHRTHCASVSIFKPVPCPAQLTMRDFNVTFLPESVRASSVTFGDARNDSGVDLSGNTVADESGLPPEILIPLNISDIKVRLVHSNECASRMLGYQILIRRDVIATHRLYHVFELGTISSADLEVSCCQNIGNVANDNKMINILSGQGSCRVKCPMSCCVVPLEKLGAAPVWIQRKLLAEKVATGTAVPADHIIIPDYERRVGGRSFPVTSALYQERLEEGQMGTDADRMRINIETGSSLYKNLTTYHCDKVNCGIFHSIQAHTTKLTEEIVRACDKRMQYSRWQHKQNKFKEGVATLRTNLEQELGKAESDAGIAYGGQLRNLRGTITRKKNKIVFMENRSANYTRDLENAEILRAEVLVLEEQVHNILNQRRDQAKDSDVGPLYLILSGLNDLEKGFDKGQDSGLPSNGVSWAFMKAIESRAGGKIDHKRTGTEQTNGKGMTCLQNWNKITTALMGLYPVGNAIHDWLGEMTPKWETLANALYSVQCFLKSQRKRCPNECDEKLFTLWKAWQDTFPGQSFNKFHALFCAIRSFIHKYHMAGRVSEESNESFNHVMDKKMTLLASMPITVGQVNLVNARTQGNLKADVSDKKMSIVEKGKGKKRGPYGPRQRYDNGTKVVTSVNGSVTFRGEQYFKLTNSNLVPEKYRDIYEWYEGRKVPKIWRDALENSAPLSMTASDLAKEHFAL